MTKIKKISHRNPCFIAMGVCGIPPDWLNVILVSCYKVPDWSCGNGRGSPARPESGKHFCACLPFRSQLCVAAEAGPCPQHCVQDGSRERAAQLGPQCRCARCHAGTSLPWHHGIAARLGHSSRALLDSGVGGSRVHWQELSS